MKLERLQFYLEPEVNEQLEKLAAQRKVSKAHLIREGVRRILQDASEDIEDPILGVVGLGASGRSDISEHHDNYLAAHQLEDG